MFSALCNIPNWFYFYPSLANSSTCVQFPTICHMYGRITFKAFYNTRCADSFHDCSVHLEEVLCFAAFSHLQDFFSLGGGISKTTLLFRGPNWSQLVIMALKNTQKHKKRCFLHKRTVDIFWPNKAYHRRAHAQSYVNQKKVSHTINAHRMET